MNTDRLRSIVVGKIDQHPSLVFNVMGPAGREPGGYHPQPGGTSPYWCVCGRCRQMPTEPEKVCCAKQTCMSVLPDVQVLILDEAVLALARMYRRDVLVFDDEADVRKANRHQAYRQFILWQHGRLGAWQRMSVEGGSCGAKCLEIRRGSSASISRFLFMPILSSILITIAFIRILATWR